MNHLHRTSAKNLLNYGLLGWALGAVAVPIYIQVPYLYSRIYEVPSAWVGVILLLSRLLDAVLDPAIGLWVDRRSGGSKPGKSGNRYALPLLLAAPLLLLGMAGVFFPFGNTPSEYAASLMVSLIVVHLGYSFASIAYQAWGAELGHTDKERSTYVAVREGVGILGVVFAVSLALETNAGLIFTVFAFMLVLGMFLLLNFSPQPDQAAQKALQVAESPLATTFHTAQVGAAAAIRKGLADIVQPLRRQNFRKLMSVFLCNGLAAALPATLVPFYMRDRLGLGDSDQWVLAVYFLVGAASTVFWVWLASKIGLARSWLFGMVLSIPAFIIVITLGEGDLAGYLLVCVVTGFALGADLSLPAALVARLIEENGERGKTEGTYFGLWNWVNKFNLALAPSFALGTLQWFSYSAEMA
ncbi:MAG: MFS transporter, partial [Limnobacter sp.]